MTRNPERGFFRKLRTSAIRTLIFVPGFLLAGAAVPRLISGLALEAAFPAPIYMDANVQLPRAAYEQARKALSQADPRDGQAKIAEAEAAHLAGYPAQEILPKLIVALNHAPGSAKGWALLAELQASQKPQSGAAALGLALEFAPFDYWLAGRRVNMGAQIWDALNTDDRASLLRQTRLLWTDEQLRNNLPPLLATEPGLRLINRAFADDPDTLRALNRWSLRDSLHNLTAP